MRTLGNYLLLDAIGMGSTGTVWRATQTDVDRTVAVKILAAGAGEERLAAEARTLASFDHPNIVRVYDYVEAGRDAPTDPAYLAEEWVDGERRDELISHLGKTRLTAEQALGVVRCAGRLGVCPRARGRSR